MPNELARLVSRIGKTQTIDDVVQSTFQKRKKDFSCDAFLPVRFFKGVSELVFQKAIDSPDLLFLSQLGPVIRKLLSSLTMLARGVIPPLDGALIRIASLPFKKEFEVLPTTKTTNRFRISRQRLPPYTLLRLGGRHPLWGMGVTSLIKWTFRPAA
jgi:hypothetical protein